MTKRATKSIAFIFSILFVTCAISFMPTKVNRTNAGMSKEVLSSTSTLIEKGAISETKYYLGTDKKLVVTDDPNNAGKQVVKFDKNATDATKLFSYSRPSDSDIGDVPILESEVEFAVLDIVEEAEKIGELSFGFAFGVQRLAEGAKSNNSAFLWVKKTSDNKLVYGLSSYLSNQERVLVEATETGNTINVKLKQYHDKHFELNVNGTQYTFTELGIGYLGFSIDGYVNKNNYIEAYVRKFDIINITDNRPENAVIDIDFDDNDLNYSLFKINSSIVIEDGVLKFENSSFDSNIITRHKYSNFELSFDVPYMKRTPSTNEYDEITSANVGFYVLQGINAENPSAVKNYQQAMGYSGMTYGRVLSTINSSTGASTGTIFRIGESGERMVKGVGEKDVPNYNLWNTTYNNRSYSVKIKYVDGKYSLAIKWEDEKQFTTIAEYDYGYTTTGYIMISASYTAGITKCNMWIDNLKIVNLDSNPNLVEVGYSHQPFKNPGEYEWIDTRNPNDLLGANNK